ncbi:MAG: ATP-dependent helicase C-terminal domain-containing protein [Candidatus Sulfotelmatobacter sp.]
MFSQPAKIELHLAFVFWLEASLLQLHHDQAFQFAVVEKQINVEVFSVEHFADKEALDHFLARLASAGFEPPDMSQMLRDLCVGLQSFGELRVAATHLIPLLEQKLNARLLSEVAPATIRLRNGRHTKIHYEAGKPPWISSRLQDFFGMQDTPRIGPDKTPLVIHLLAPNHRAVQTTTDLAGFWERLDPQVRRELMRRYPKHAWPERPQV